MAGHGADCITARARWRTDLANKPMIGTAVITPSQSPWPVFMYESGSAVQDIPRVIFFFHRAAPILTHQTRILD